MRKLYSKFVPVAVALLAAASGFFVSASLTGGSTHIAKSVTHRPVRIAAALTSDVVYTVRPGDTLSKIAQAQLGNPGDWPTIWQLNRAMVPNPNRISIGMRLTLSSFATTSAAPSRAVDGDGDYDNDSSDASPSASAVRHTTVSYATSTTYTGSNSYQQCVIRTESGGNAQVMNATGHYGLYQFSAQTWSAYGGNPADFGHASVAEQNQVFANAIAQGGQSNWSPYDGC